MRAAPPNEATVLCCPPSLHPVTGGTGTVSAARLARGGGRPVSSGERPEDVADAAAPPRGHVGPPRSGGALRCWLGRAGGCGPPDGRHGGDPPVIGHGELG